MRTARDWGDPPLIWWGCKSRTKRVVLMVKLALRLFENSLCRCGHSAFLAHGDQGAGEYERTVFTCHACKEAASKGEGEDDKDADKPWRVASVRDLHDTPKDPDEELPDHSAFLAGVVEVADE